MTEPPFIEIPQEWHWRPDIGKITEQTPLSEYLAELHAWILENRPAALQLIFKDRCDIYKVIPVPDDEIMDFDIQHGVGPASLERILWSQLSNVSEQLVAFQESLRSICHITLPDSIYTLTAPVPAPDLLKILGRINFSS